MFWDRFHKLCRQDAELVQLEVHAEAGDSSTFINLSLLCPNWLVLQLFQQNLRIIAGPHSHLAVCVAPCVAAPFVKQMDPPGAPVRKRRASVYDVEEAPIKVAEAVAAEAEVERQRVVFVDPEEVASEVWSGWAYGICDEFWGLSFFGVNKVG